MFIYNKKGLQVIFFSYFYFSLHFQTISMSVKKKKTSPIIVNFREGKKKKRKKALKMNHKLQCQQRAQHADIRWKQTNSTYGSRGCCSDYIYTNQLCSCLLTRFPSTKANIRPYYYYYFFFSIDDIIYLMKYNILHLFFSFLFFHLS